MTRSIWLFSLLKPRALDVYPAGSARLHCVQRDRIVILDHETPLRISMASAVTNVTGPDGAPAWFQLAIPQLTRQFFGTLDVAPGSDMLMIRLHADVEVATNCVVGAELPVSRAGPHALAAQAITSRSVLMAAAGPRHSYADFCDTTHCQFFRSPSVPGSLVWQSVAHTRGVVLTSYGRAVGVRYSGACGGRTEAGTDAGVQYESVVCQTCRRNRFPRRGHGWGLCQEGAMDLARQGEGYLAILRHYYPNLTAEPFPSEQLPNL